MSWRDGVDAVMWRADESDLLPADPVQAGGVLTRDPALPEAWWTALNDTLDALAAHRTNRTATPDTVTIAQTHVGEVVQAAFPDAVNTAVERWTPAHADLNWANVTAPKFCLFDWEDWGMAPRGLDAACLWAQSLGVPALADRVRRERAGDLSSRDGKVMMLFACAKIAGPDAQPQDPRLEPARAAAERLVQELQRGRRSPLARARRDVACPPDRHSRSLNLPDDVPTAPRLRLTGRRPREQEPVKHVDR